MAQRSEPILLNPMVHCSLSVQEPLMKSCVVPQVRHLLLPARGAQVPELGCSLFLLMLSVLLTHLQRPWKLFLDSPLASPVSRAYAHAQRTPAGAGASILQSLLLSAVGARLWRRALLQPLSWDDREALVPL